MPVWQSLQLVVLVSHTKQFELQSPVQILKSVSRYNVSTLLILQLVQKSLSPG